MNEQVEKIIREKLIRTVSSGLSCNICNSVFWEDEAILHFEECHDEVISAIEAGIEAGYQEGLSENNNIEATGLFECHSCGFKGVLTQSEAEKHFCNPERKKAYEQGVADTLCTSDDFVVTAVANKIKKDERERILNEIERNVRDSRITITTKCGSISYKKHDSDFDILKLLEKLREGK